MNNNPRPHTGVIARDYLKNANIPQRQRLPHNQDLNPAVHVWDISGRRIAKSYSSEEYSEKREEEILSSKLNELLPGINIPPFPYFILLFN